MPLPTLRLPRIPSAAGASGMLARLLFAFRSNSSIVLKFHWCANDCSVPSEIDSMQARTPHLADVCFRLVNRSLQRGFFLALMTSLLCAAGVAAQVNTLDEARRLL